MQKMIKRLLLTAVATGAAIAAGMTFTTQGIKTGIAKAPLGSAAQYSVAIHSGFQLATDEINTVGDINGSKIALVIEDKQGKKEEAVNVFKKLIFQNEATVVFDPTPPNSAQVADPITQVSKTVALGTPNATDGITSTDDFVFRDSVTGADMLSVIIQIAVKRAGVKEVVVLYGNDDVFTKNGYGNFKKVPEDLKVPVTIIEMLVRGDVDFRTQLTKVKTMNPDVTMLSVPIAEGGLTMVQAHQLDLNVSVIDDNGMNSVKVFGLAKDKSDSPRVDSLWSIENHTPGGSRFITVYITKYRIAPDQFVMQAYDTMHIVSKALRTVKFSGNLEAGYKAIRDVLSAIKHTSATGAFVFCQVTARGKSAGYDVIQTPIVSMTRSGKYTIGK